MNTKLRKAIVKMMQSSKVDFFLGEILNKEFVCDNDMPMATMATDGVKIFYADEWVEKCSIEELTFCIVHEFYHIIFKHADAVKTMNLHPKKSNIAQDVVINAMLGMDKIGSAPEGTIASDYNGTCELTVNGTKVVIKEAHKKSFLEVYKMLPDMPNDEKPGYGSYKVSQDGDKKHATDEVIPTKLTDEQSSDIDGDVHNIEAKSKTQGKGGAFARAIGELTKGVVPWKNFIRPVVDHATAGFPTYTRPKRRATESNIIFPSIKRMGVNVTVAIDTSGSIGRKELSYFMGEMDNLMKSYPKGAVTMNVLYHTDMVYETATNCKNLSQTIKRTQSGGTCHHDVFKKAEELKSKVLVCLTDGYSSYPDTTTINNTIFICIEKNGSVPAFAKRVDVDTSTWGIDNG